MIIDKTLKILEFDVILGLLSNFAVSRMAKDFILQITPSTNFDEICHLGALTDEAYLVKEKYILNPIIRFDDIEEMLLKAKLGSILTLGELLMVAGVLRSGRIARNIIESSGDDIVLLKNLVSGIVLPKELEKELTSKIISDSEMSDDASEKLKSIRRKLLSANIRLKDKLNSYTKSSEISKYLQDNLVTIRNGRYVIPVRSEYRGEIQGLIHDQSSSGATVFIEPFSVVELNNELRSLQLEEAIEMERILSELTKKVAESFDNISTCLTIIIELDVIFAKSAFSVSYQGISPTINQNGSVNLINSRHPLIAKEKIIPVSIRVGSDYRLLLISGPNTGGKTVCLKTVGLFCLMGYIGLKLPCGHGSGISVFEDIFCDIGDEQSIMNSLSTFSSHINNIVFITNNIKRNTLVLLDEIGGGTDPLEGAALAVGILKYIEKVGAVAIVTTHYPELKEYAFLSSNIENACMLFDEKTLKPSYKLVIGMPGTSNALRIARNLGIKDSIIDESYKNIDSEKIRFENILKNAEEIKNKSLEEYQKYLELKHNTEKEKELVEADREKMRKKLERFDFNSKIEIRKYIAKSLEEADELIDEIKQKIQESSEYSLLAAKKLRKQLEDIQYKNSNEEDTDICEYKDITDEDIEVGKKVAVKSLKMLGEIKTLPNKNKEVVVSIGSVKMNVKISDLAFCEIKKKKPIQVNLKKINQPSNNLPPKEVKVLGMTVAEALEIIEPILYHMYTQNDGKILKIIHGKGSGALGRGIHSFLRSIKYVDSFRYGKYGEGEHGVTFIEIK